MVRRRVDRMSEQYLGTATDRKYIKIHLANIRKLNPIEIATVSDPINLADIDRLVPHVEIEKFWELIHRTLARLERRYRVKIKKVPQERCYTALSPDPNAIGGFHDHWSLGYQYWYQASFVIMLGEMVSKKLRTAELARSFIHDCIHHSTFRSFRRAIRIPAKSPKIAKHRVPEIYREQYGINFRNKDGLSYSSPKLTAHSPKRINLNLLMDGVVALATASALRVEIGAMRCRNTLEAEIKKEILLESFNGVLLRDADNFYNSVTKPSKVFIEYWGGDYLTALVLQAMMNGNIAHLRQFFEERTKIENAWEKMFKRPEFSICQEE